MVHGSNYRDLAKSVAILTHYGYLYCTRKNTYNCCFCLSKSCGTSHRFILRCAKPSSCQARSPEWPFVIEVFCVHKWNTPKATKNYMKPHMVYNIHPCTDLLRPLKTFANQSVMDHLSCLIRQCGEMRSLLASTASSHRNIATRTIIVCCWLHCSNSMISLWLFHLYSSHVLAERNP